jgi:hypothetical protein
MISKWVYGMVNRFERFGDIKCTVAPSPSDTQSQFRPTKGFYPQFVRPLQKKKSRCTTWLTTAIYRTIIDEILLCLGFRYNRGPGRYSGEKRACQCVPCSAFCLPSNDAIPRSCEKKEDCTTRRCKKSPDSDRLRSLGERRKHDK